MYPVMRCQILRLLRLYIKNPNVETTRAGNPRGVTSSQSNAVAQTPIQCARTVDRQTSCPEEITAANEFDRRELGRPRNNKAMQFYWICVRTYDPPVRTSANSAKPKKFTIMRTTHCCMVSSIGNLFLLYIKWRRAN